MYLDRIYESSKYSNLENKEIGTIPQLVCPNCKELLGVAYTYKKENRLTFRLFAGEIAKKIVKHQ